MSAVTQRRPFVPDPIDVRLLEWAEWAVGEGLRASFGSFWRDSARSADQRGYIPPRVEEVEKAIAQMAIDLGKRYKTAIFRRFLVGIPDEEAAAIMGISVYRYRWMLDEARDYLSARLLTRAAGTR